MSAADAWRDGIRRVNRAPWVILGMWMMTAGVSLPLALVMRGMIAQHLGESLTGDRAAAGVEYEWMQEFADQANGLGVTFKPTIVGFAAVLDNLSAFLDDVSRPVVIVGAAAAYIVLWLFAAGGIIDRYARDRPTRTHGFFAAAGVFFFRFLRLAAIQWAVYALLFGPLHSWLFGPLFERLTHDTTVERNAFLLRAGFYLVFGTAIAICNVTFDYAKVRAVVEDRHSMIGTVVASLRFVGRNPAAGLLFALDFAMFAGVVALYALVAPGVGGRTLAVWLGFATGQLYVIARLWVKLVFWGSEAALFQSRLAHAGYVARPLAVWPESPAAEAILP